MEGSDDLSAAFDEAFGELEVKQYEGMHEGFFDEAAAEALEQATAYDNKDGYDGGDERMLGSEDEPTASMDGLSDCSDALRELEELAAAEGEGLQSSMAPNAAFVDPGHPAAKRHRPAGALCPARDSALLHGTGGGDENSIDASIELPCSQGTRSTPTFELGQPASDPKAYTAAEAPSLQQECEHPSYWAGMCVCCGALKPEDDGAAAAAAARGGGEACMKYKAAGGGLRQRSNAVGSAGDAVPAVPAAEAPSLSAGTQLPGGEAQEAAAPIAVRRNPPKLASAAAVHNRKLEALSQQGRQGPGTSLQQQPEPLTRIRHLHERGQMEVSAGEAARVRQLEVARLLSSHRLVLILDLDHTLLHSIRLAEVQPEHAAQLEAVQRAELGQPEQSLHCLRHQNLWTKLRPGVHKFLEACRGLFEMHIYTMGDRSYAAQIRALLDPQRRLFSSVISQNDSTSYAAKDLDVALADHRIVLILDDTEHVWPHHRQNLIQIERYHFFPGTMRPINGMSGLLDLKQDESSSQGTLPTVLGVLQDVHARFFASTENGAQGGEDGEELPLEKRDVRYCLLQRRELILQGCHLCFSHCWPQAYPSPSSHPLWLLAEFLGANCHPAYKRDVTTHMVAGSAATDKAIQARRHGKHVVLPDWLKACMFRWRREDEVKYAPTRPTPQLFLSPLVTLQMAEPPPLPPAAALPTPALLGTTEPSPGPQNSGVAAVQLEHVPPTQAPGATELLVGPQGLAGGVEQHGAGHAPHTKQPEKAQASIAAFGPRVEAQAPGTAQSGAGQGPYTVVQHVGAQVPSADQPITAQGPGVSAQLEADRGAVGAAEQQDGVGAESGKAEEGKHGAEAAGRRGGQGMIGDQGAIGT